MAEELGAQPSVWGHSERGLDTLLVSAGSNVRKRNLSGGLPCLVRWCSCNTFSTQDRAAAATAEAGSSMVFAGEVETLQIIGGAPNKMRTGLGAIGCDLLVDDGVVAALLIHRGKEFEGRYAQDGSLPESASTGGAEFKCFLQLLKDSIPANKTSTREGRRLAEASSLSGGLPRVVRWCSCDVFSALDLAAAAIAEAGTSMVFAWKVENLRSIGGAPNR